MIETLSLPEQQTLIEIIQKRISLKRRGQIATSIAEAHEEYKAGKTRRVPVDELMAELEE